MNPNEYPSRNVAVLAAIDPHATAAGSVSTPWVDAGAFHSIMCMVLVGTLGSSATIDAKVEQATDASGTGAKDVAGKAIAQLTQAGTDDSDKQAIIDLMVDELDIAGGFTHVRLSLTVGTATSDVAAVMTGLAPRYAPASDADAASVAEVAA